MKKYIKPGAELKHVELEDAVVQASLSIESGSGDSGDDGPVIDADHSLSKGNNLWDDLSDW